MRPPPPPAPPPAPPKKAKLPPLPPQPVLAEEVVAFDAPAVTPAAPAVVESVADRAPVIAAPEASTLSPVTAAASAAPELEAAAAAAWTLPLPVVELEPVELPLPARREGGPDRTAAAKELIATCERELLTSPPAARAGRLHYEIARLAECPLFDAELAARHYKAACTLCPTHLPTLRGARRAFLAKGDAVAVLPLFDAELPLLRAPEDKARLLYEKGVLLETVLSQPAAARTAYAEARGFAPQDPSVLRACLLAEWKAAEWDAVSSILSELSTLATESATERAALIAAQARVLLAKKRQKKDAAELYEQALRMDPRATSVAATLETLLHGAEGWPELAELLLAEAEKKSDPAARAGLLAEAARLHAEMLGGPRRATELLESALALLPGDPALLAQLEVVAEQSQDFAGLCRTLQRLEAITSHPTDKVALLHRIGVLQRERLGNLEEALAAHQRALTLDPGFRPAADAALEILRQAGAHEQVLAVLRKEAATPGDTAQRVAAYLDAADLCERKLGQPAEAEVCVRHALELDPKNRPAFSTLARLLQARQDWRALAELYERGADTADDIGEKIAYLMKIAVLQEEAGGSPEDAVRTYRRALQLAPKRLDAMRGLQRAAERAGAFQELLEALEHELEFWPDKTVQASLLHRMGRISERNLADDARAVTYYDRAVKLLASYEPALSALGELYQRHGRWEELATNYVQRLALEGSAGTKAELCHRLGSLYAEQLAKPEEALKYYRRALTTEPKFEEARRSLLRVLSASGQWEEVTKILEQELQHVESPPQRAQVALRLAEVLEYRVKARPRALKAYEQAVAADPGLAPAARGRARLLEHANDHARLAKELERDASASTEASGRAGALFRAALTARDHLSDPQGAVQKLEAVLSIHQEDPGALIALEQLYTELGNWSELARVLRLSATSSRVQGLQVAGLRALAVALERQTGDKDEAQQAADASGVRSALDALLKLAPKDVLALSSLERVALSRQDMDTVAWVDKSASAAGVDAELTAAHRTRLAEALEAAGDPAALAVYESALELDAQNLAAARGISRMARTSGSPSLLQKAARHEADVLQDQTAAIELLALAAEQLRSQGDTESAAEALEEALRLSPGDTTLRRALAQLLTKLGQFGRLAERLATAAASAPNRGDRASLWVEAAKVQASHLLDNGAAIASLGRAIALEPQNTEALLLQASLYEQAALWPKAVESLRAVVAAKPAQDLMNVANFRLATLLAQRLDQSKIALTHVTSLLADEPKHVGGLRLAVSIKRSLKDYRGARAAALELTELCSAPQDKAAVLLEQALIERDGGTTSAASDAFRGAIALVGLGDGAAAAFRQWAERLPAAERRTQYEAYAETLASYVSGTARAPQLEEAYKELASTYQTQLHQPDRAVSTLKRALLQLPQSLSLRADLAVVLASKGQHADAAAEYVSVLSASPYEVAHWRALSEELARANRLAESGLALGPVAALGEATPEEKGRLLPALLPKGTESLVSQFPHLVSVTPQEGAATALSSALVPALYRLFPGDLDSYKVSARDRLTSRTQHPLREAADRIARVLGAPEFDLYVHRSARGAVQLEFTETPSILVSEEVAAMDEATRMFLLAVPLAGLATELQVVQRVEDDALRKIYSAALHGVDAKAARVLVGELDHAAEAKRVHKAMPWGRRRPLDDAAKQYAETMPDFTAWAFHARLTALRIAMVLVPDLEVGMRAFHKLDAGLGVAGAAQAETRARLFGESLCFALSDVARAARTAAGLA